MSNFHLFVLLLLFVITLISILIGLSRKNNFPHMTGMITSMYLGMNVGLTAGVTFGIVYQGDLFHSTILGIAFGTIAGSLCGLCYGLLSFIEGLMSGLMGGMMGAMLGEMIAVEQANVFIKFFLLLSICTIFLLIIISTSKKDTINNVGWLFKPILTSLLIACVLFLGNSLNMEKAVSKSISHDHEQDTHKESETKTEIKKIFIETSGMSYSPEEVVVEKDMPITFVLKNSDQIEHDIEIKGASFNVVSDSNDLSHQHEVEENVIHLHAEPQTSSEITFSLNEVGTNEFYCTIPGHKESGMVGKLVVK